MLTLNQVVSSKNEDKSVKFAELIPAVYYNFGAKDETKDFTTKIKDGDAKFSNVKKDREFPYKVPSKAVSVLDPEADLFPEMLQDLQTRYPGTSPWTKILEFCSVGVNLDIKTKAIENLSPADPFVIAQKMYKTMKGNGVPVEYINPAVTGVLVSMHISQDKITEALEKMAA